MSTGWAVGMNEFEGEGIGVWARIWLTAVDCVGCKILF